MKNLLILLQGDGFVVESVTPISCGVGQFQCGPIDQRGTHLTKWLNPSVGGYGFGYSYTNGSMILASKSHRENKPRRKKVMNKTISQIIAMIICPVAL